MILKSKAGDRFTVTVADGTVLMSTVRVRCGDVWDCEPVGLLPRDTQYAQEYGSHMVFTDEQVAEKVAHFKQWG